MGNFIIDILNWLISALGSVLLTIISILPPSPFHAIQYNSSISEFVGGLAWVLPIPQILGLMEAWVVAIGLYYANSVIMRWIKLIG